jgi:lipoprotein-anchoring transpeptidase ErfK/SrfK
MSLVAAAAAVTFAACGTTHNANRTSVPTTTATVPARSAPTPTTTTTVPAYESLTAQAIVPHLVVYRSPNAHTPARVLDNPWLVDPSQPATAVPQVFLVEARRPDGWVRVLLPVRPNGSSGWVRATDVTLSPVTFKVRVQLGVHRLTVFDHGQVVYRGPVADGAPATPTPVGRYYVRVLIKAPDPNTVYGPYAYGLSSHSDALTSFDGGDAEIGIHGNDDASVLGESVTHGCIRIDNTEITALAGTLPLGTPVDIEP